MQGLCQAHLKKPLQHIYTIRRHCWGAIERVGNGGPLKGAPERKALDCVLGRALREASGGFVGACCRGYVQMVRQTDSNADSGCLRRVALVLVGCISSFKFMVGMMKGKGKV